MVHQSQDVVNMTDKDMQDDWMAGFNVYMAGHDISRCANRLQQRGWWTACEAEAEASTREWMDKQAKYEIEDDYDFIRTGC